MSMRESWQLIMRESKFRFLLVDAFAYIVPGIMRGQEMKRTLRSCIKTLTVACFDANVVQSLISPTRTMTLKLVNDGSDESLRR